MSLLNCRVLTPSNVINDAKLNKHNAYKKLRNKMEKIKQEIRGQCKIVVIQL